MNNPADCDTANLATEITLVRGLSAGGIPSNRIAATALAELLSRLRSCERIAEALVRWARE